VPRLLCADGGKVSAATKQATVRGGMMEAEARNILNVKPKAPEAEVQEVRMHGLGLLGFELLHCHVPQRAAVAASARETLLVACCPCCG
jgi:hypothetical protein